MLKIDTKFVEKSKIFSGYKKCVFVVGAGISVASGIPDFRSDSGIFASLRQQFKINGKHLFSYGFGLKEETRKVYLKYISSLKDLCDSAKPNKTHEFLCKFPRSRVYTQNIDGLEERCGMSFIKKENTKGIYLHGNLFHLSCHYCGSKIPFGDSEKMKFAQEEEIFCEECKLRTEINSRNGLRKKPVGVMHPSIIHYQQIHPDAAFIGKMCEQDIGCDLFIVIGTSLSVDGIKKLVKAFCRSPSCYGKRILVNLTQPNKEWYDYFDYFFEGDCNDFVEAYYRRKLNKCKSSMNLDDSVTSETMTIDKLKFETKDADDGCILNDPHTVNDNDCNHIKVGKEVSTEKIKSMSSSDDNSSNKDQSKQEDSFNTPSKLPELQECKSDRTSMGNLRLKLPGISCSADSSNNSFLGDMRPIYSTAESNIKSLKQDELDALVHNSNTNNSEIFGDLMPTRVSSIDLDTGSYEEDMTVPCKKDETIINIDNYESVLEAKAPSVAGHDSSTDVNDDQINTHLKRLSLNLDQPNEGQEPSRESRSFIEKLEDLSRTFSDEELINKDLLEDLIKNSVQTEIDNSFNNELEDEIGSIHNEAIKSRQSILKPKKKKSKKTH